MTQQDTADDSEKSKFRMALDQMNAATESEWQSTSITAEIEVYVPKGNGEELLKAAQETWEKNAEDDEEVSIPRQFRDAPKHQLKEYMAETLAKERFLHRHDVRSKSHIDTFATTDGRTMLMKANGDDPSGRYTAEVWTVVVRL